MDYELRKLTQATFVIEPRLPASVHHDDAFSVVVMSSERVNDWQCK
jgi:hypothetical protein